MDLIKCGIDSLISNVRSWELNLEISTKNLKVIKWRTRWLISNIRSRELNQEVNKRNFNQDFKSRIVEIKCYKKL